ncbi:hypothetical protein BAY13_10470 [Elizabethkingia bruuniana]|nr:hypothetical protein BAY13_10470 [Elizabethkingia bruuniana]
MIICNLSLIFIFLLFSSCCNLNVFVCYEGVFLYERENENKKDKDYQEFKQIEELIQRQIEKSLSIQTLLYINIGIFDNYCKN